MKKLIQKNNEKLIIFLWLIIGVLPSWIFSDVVFPDDLDDALFPKTLSREEEPVLFYLDTSPLGFDNFGDTLSQRIVERILSCEIQVTTDPFIPRKKLLALGSILRFAKNGDIVWGAGVNGRHLDKNQYHFADLDVRAVRGPLTKEFLENLGIHCPEIYGDPALLLPKYFPEFKKKAVPSKNYSIIAHFEDEDLLQGAYNFISVKEKWNEVIEKILDSNFIISTSLHGIIVAEAFGIPARLLRLSAKEPLFKFADYYKGTGRPHFKYATSIEEALRMGGESMPTCDLEKLSNAFPYEYWVNASYMKPLVNFEEYIQKFVLETKKIEIPGYPSAFNPSIIKWQDKLLLCFRTRNVITGSTDKIGFIWLDDEFHPMGQPILLEERYPRPSRSWVQDPRMIKIQDRYYLVYSNLVQLEKEEVRRMFVAELFFDGQRFYIEKPDVYLDCDNDLRAKEKNWVPFEYDGSLMLAYSLLPHRIMKPLMKTTECKTVSITTSPFSWNLGELRGGTPACLVGDQYLAFFHSSKKMTTAHSHGQRMLHYFMGAYTFSAKPPFEITRMSYEPIVGRDFYTDASYTTWTPLRVVFPVGYVFDENYIWISYGKQDHEIWIAKIDREGLFRSLSAVPISKN